MNNLYKNVKLGGTAIAVLIATSFATAYGQGNGTNQPSGQAGGTGTSNVVVTNTPAQPVPVKEQNNPAFQPFQWQGQPGVSLGNNYTITTFTVPAGKRLVIEEISAQVYVSGAVTGEVPRLILGTQAGGAWVNTFTPMTYAGNEGVSPTYAASQPLRMYADPGSTVDVELKRSSDLNGNYSGTLISTITVTGYLVNVP